MLLHTLFSLLGGQLLVILEGPLTLSTSSRIATNIGFSKKLEEALPCDTPTLPVTECITLRCKDLFMLLSEHGLELSEGRAVCDSFPSPSAQCTHEVVSP